MDARVLVADDDAPTLAILSAELERLGWKVTRAEDGGELLQALADSPFDLVVTDIAMPWMTGLQVAHSARIAGLGTPLILITALPIRESCVAMLGDHAVLLRKPFAMRQLITMAQQLLHADL